MRRPTAELRRAAIICNHKKSRNIIKPDKNLNLDSLYSLYIYKDDSIDDVMRLLTRIGDYSYRKSGNTILLIKQ